MIRLVDKSVISQGRRRARRRPTRVPDARHHPRVRRRGAGRRRAARRTSATGSSPATCRWRGTSASTWSTTTSSTGSASCSASTPTSGPRSGTRSTRPTATATGTAPSSPSRLYGYWHMSGLLREGKHWLDKVLERFPDPSSSERGWALVVRGYLGAMQGEAAEAVADATAGTRIGEQRGDPKLVGRGYTLPDARADDRRPVRGGPRGRRRRPSSGWSGSTTVPGCASSTCTSAHVAQLSGDFDGALRYAAQVTRRFGEDGESGEIKERWAQGWAYTISAMAMYWDPARHDGDRHRRPARPCSPSTSSATSWGWPTAWRSTAGWPPGPAATSGRRGCSARPIRSGSGPAAGSAAPPPC